MLEGALELAKDWSRRGEFLERSAPLPFMSESWSMLWLVVLVGEETSMGSPLLVADMLGTGAETGMMRGPIICGGTVISVVVVWGLAILVAICAQDSSRETSLAEPKQLGASVGISGGRGLRGEVVVEAGLVPPEGILSSFWNAANWNRKAA
jgi:hypothetical protein